MRGSAQNLDHDGLLGGAESLHRLVVGGLGEVLAIDLEGETQRRTNQQLSSRRLSASLMGRKQEGTDEDATVASFSFHLL